MEKNKREGSSVLDTHQYHTHKQTNKNWFLKQQKDVVMANLFWHMQNLLVLNYFSYSSFIVISAHCELENQGYKNPFVVWEV